MIRPAQYVKSATWQLLTLASYMGGTNRSTQVQASPFLAYFHSIPSRLLGCNLQLQSIEVPGSKRG